MVQRAMQDVFEAIERTPGRDFLLRLSMMEIYNEVSRRGWAPIAACLLAGLVVALATGSNRLRCCGSHGLTMLLVACCSATAFQPDVTGRAEVHLGIKRTTGGPPSSAGKAAHGCAACARASA